MAKDSDQGGIGFRVTRALICPLPHLGSMSVVPILWPGSMESIPRCMRGKPLGPFVFNGILESVNIVSIPG